MYSSTTIINENTVANNIASGIFLRNSNDSCICWNAVSYSENGIELTYFSSDNNIHNNSLTENSIGIHVSSDAEGNCLSDNVFLGNNETKGGEAVVSGVYDNFSVSVGAFNYDTDGFRANNGISHDG